METIFNRRSIRKYKDKPVAENKIKQILKAGMAAPSAMDEQPWQFVVIDKRELLDQIPEFHNYAEMVKEAPVVILVAGDKTKLEADDEEVAFNYMIQDCSAAIQNMLLAAESEDLGSVWLGIHPRKGRKEKLVNLFALPEHIVPMGLVVIGHPDEEKPAHDRYLEERVHRNQYNK